ncbi:MAG: sigma-70 family RNA polymerase sigma factor [Syntrophobacteraceae bacterium]
MKVDDNEVIKRFQNGDTEAFAHLVVRYHRKLLNFIYRLVGDKAPVEDLGQDVFLNVFRGLPEFNLDRGVPFSAWLFIVARNRCISELRARGERCFVDLDAIEHLSSNAHSAEEVLLARERREALRSSLELLPEPYRITLLQSLNGHSLEEIAIAWGLSAGTVKSRLFRARQRVKTLVGQWRGGKSHERV